MPEPVSVPDRDGKIQCAWPTGFVSAVGRFFMSAISPPRAGSLPILRQLSRMFYNNFTRVKI